VTGPSALVPIEPKASSMVIHTSNKLVLNDVAPAGLYPGLVDSKPGVRAQRLAEALFGCRLELPAAGKAVELRDCLREARTADRRELLSAYWRARQCAADYQVLEMHGDWLTELTPVTLEHRSRLGGPEEMLRLRAAQLAVKASLLDAQVRLLDAQFDLTRQAGLPLDSAWLLPTTAPHAGPYQLKLEAQPPQVANSLRVKRLATIIPSLASNLHDRSASVVEADGSRAVAMAAYQAGQHSLDHVLDALNRQTTETRAFLETVTEYNRALAAYVLNVAGSTVPSDKLVDALVLAK
jgi:hypothetical protein